MDVLTQILNLPVFSVQTLMLVIARVSGLFLEAPVISNQNIPVLVKIGLVICMAFCLVPFVMLPVAAGGDATQLYATPIQFFLAMAQELFIGIVLGFCARLLFIGVQIAGQFIDYQMGFGFVNVIDPESRVQIPIMGQFLYIMALFVFLLINGHHWVLQSLVKSFQVIPLGGMAFQPVIIERIGTFFANIFVVAFKVAAPVMVTLFIIDLACGVIARAVPQANILVVGFPLKIGVGFIVSIISLPMFFLVMKKFFVQMIGNFELLLKLM
jgi:flagellar biosynthesis protein FliR